MALAVSSLAKRGETLIKRPLEPLRSEAERRAAFPRGRLIRPLSRVSAPKGHLLGPFFDRAHERLCAGAI
jgi:hypothetical protein